MDAIIKERQLTPAQEEELDLREIAPDKFEPEFDPDIQFRVNKHAADPVKSNGYGFYSREDVAELMSSTGETYVSPKETDLNYPTFSLEQVQQFMRDHDEYLERKKAIKREKDEWDLQKMTESELKIEPATKPSASTKT